MKAGATGTRHHWLSLVLISLIAVLSLAGLSHVHADEADSQVADKLAKAVGDRLSQAVQELKALASDSSTIAVFKKKDPAALQATAADAVQKITSALKLRFFLPGRYKLDRDSKPPLGYASLDLLKQAEQSPERIEAELLNPGEEQEHIVLVERVMEGEKLLGLIHLSLDATSFKELPKDQVGGGYAELVQVFGTNTILMGKAGNVGKRQGEAVRSRIAGAHWRIDYWPQAMASDTRTLADDLDINALLSRYTPSPTVLAGAGAGVVLLLLLLLLRKRRRAAKAGQGDENEKVVYAGSVKAIMEGKHPGTEKLVPDLPQMGQTSEVKPLSQGMSSEEADDITEISIPKKKPAKLAPTNVKAEDTAPPAKAKPEIAADPAPASKKAEAGTPPVPDVAEAKTGAAAKPTEELAGEGTASSEKVELSPTIFRAYDIRGVVGKTLTPEIVSLIGKAIGTEAGAMGQHTIAVGRDGRVSSPNFARALIKGLRESGRDVCDIGMVPTPLLYFATHYLETQSGVMLTGSHNGPEYNGLKIMLGGMTLSGDAIQSIRQRAESGEVSSGDGSIESRDIIADYIRRATEDVYVALGGGFKLVVDCGNGVAGIIAPQLYRALGHDVIELFCDVDGTFPNHHPDPSQPENLKALIAKVRETQADLGLAFDGDGDRLGVVDGEGNIIWPDRQMMLFARDVLSRNQGSPIIFDVKCSRHLKTVIEEAGGKPLMWKTGHSLIKSKMKEVDAPLAGEMSGHIFFSERWYGFDDALYSGVRMLEILTNSLGTPTEVFAKLPESCATPELRISLSEKHHANFMEMMREKMAFDNAEITDIDGLRVDFPYGWGLVRPSNTSPFLIARFEADDEASLDKIKSEFRELLRKVIPNMKLPF